MSEHHDSSGKQFPVNKPHFTADTGRRHSHSKRHSKIRHVLAIVSVMCPLAALFVYLMSLFRLPEQRAAFHYHQLCIGFLAAGMIALFFYLIAYANQQRRHRIAEINRVERHRRQDEALRAEREALAKRAAQAAAQAQTTPPTPPA